MNNDLGILGIQVETIKPGSPNQASPSRTAETTTLVRSGETLKPAGVRLFSDPYAIRFINPELLAWFAAHPAELQAIVKEEERRFPGMNSAIVARTRYFDDIIGKCLEDGLEQLIIMGAGFDARAHRIPGLSTKTRIFELDHPDTQAVKQSRVREIFGHPAGNVTYVPADLRTAAWQDDLVSHGYDPAKVSLFILEGLCMYLPPETIDSILGFVVNHAGPASSVLFDYPDVSLVDGTDDSAIARNFRNRVEQLGEPLRFGITTGNAVAFLKKRGFESVHVLSPADVNDRYFLGRNADRPMCCLFSFAHAEILSAVKKCPEDTRISACRRGLL